MRVLMRGGTSGVDDAFVELPHSVYADDPAWIPEEPDALALAFSSGNAWHRAGRAATLCAPGRARLAVFRPTNCEIAGRPAAFFGYWEQRDNGDAPRRLLAEAEAWAAGEGAEVLYGPVNFSTFGTYRLRLSAEPGGAPFPGEPYNPGGYAASLEAAGFTAAQHYVTQVGRARTDRLDEKRESARRARAEGYTLEPLDGEGWLAMLPELHRAADDIFGENFGYTPLSLEAFAAGHGEGVARRLCPHTSLVARAPDGALAGLALVFPHYGPLCAQGASPAPVPVSALSWAEHAPMLARLGDRVAVLKTLGVARAHRRRGVMDALVLATLERGREHYDRWLGALIRADNHSRRFGDGYADAERWYALYAKALDGSGRVAAA